MKLMKKQLKTISLLTLTILSALAITNKLTIINVSATYVEGHISQDTTWTLTDSPYIASKDLIIDPGATLTIMPGVEVRFGGNFILAVIGRLSAIGTSDKMITFTSNKIQPQAGDWNTIKFNGTQQSTMVYSVVKYAANGITIQHGNVEIRNCLIISNSESGIYALSANQATIKQNTIRSNQNGILLKYGTSGVNISDNEVSSNAQNGVYINAYAYVEASTDYSSGTATAEIHDIWVSGNNVSNNGNGIYLHSQSIANASYYYNDVVKTNASIYDVTVSDNIIKSNTNHGIRVYSYAENWFDTWYTRQVTQSAEANASVRATILGNTLSANSKGVYESGQTSVSPLYATPLHSIIRATESVDITRNSVSYSNFGVLFERATNNVANYNDIYSNTYGMNVSLGATVNAEHNYWGDPSGPYHLSLNPAGKGNPVNGDGVNLDFIPFLTAPSGYVNERPTARLTSDKTTVALNQPVTFDGSTSSDDRRVDKYFFDFGDEKDSGWTTLSVFVHNYTLAGVYQASLTVMDDFGVVSNNNATVAITAQQLPSIYVSLTLNRSSVGSEGKVSLTAHVTNGTLAVQDASVRLVSNKGGSFTPVSGYTNSKGDFSATFTAPKVTEQTNVKITATASRSGYADGSDYEDLEVLPPGAPSLTVQVLVSSSNIQPLATSNVTVHVTYNANPIPNATVRTSSNGGNLTAQTGSTDSNGDFSCAFKAPQTTTQLNITITAIAIKSGYLDGTGQTQIVVSPEVSSPSAAGLPITMVLLILVPVIVVVVAAVLIVRKRRAMISAPNPMPNPGPNPAPSPR